MGPAPFPQFRTRHEAIQWSQQVLFSLGAPIPIVDRPQEKGAIAFEDHIQIGNVPTAAIPAVIFHEAGHVLRKDMQLLRNRIGDASDVGVRTLLTRWNEIEADTIAGLIAGMYGADIRSYIAVIASHPSSPTHGTATERAALALNGYRVGASLAGRV